MRTVILIAALALGWAGSAAAQAPPATGPGDMATPEPLTHTPGAGSAAQPHAVNTGLPYPSPLPPGGTGTSDGSAARAPVPAPFANPAPVPGGNVEVPTLR